MSSKNFPSVISTPLFSTGKARGQLQLGPTPSQTRLDELCDKAQTSVGICFHVFSYVSYACSTLRNVDTFVVSFHSIVSLSVPWKVTGRLSRLKVTTSEGTTRNHMPYPAVILVWNILRCSSWIIVIYCDAFLYLMLYVMLLCFSYVFIGFHICLALHMLRFALNGWNCCECYYAALAPRFLLASAWWPPQSLTRASQILKIIRYRIEVHGVQNGNAVEPCIMQC